ncbi:MAG: hypothetical protein JXA20_06000 [Spirochaetes bacterium]|nr:hypothetical protein [Spirochaetota bacterium]
MVHGRNILSSTLILLYLATVLTTAVADPVPEEHRAASIERFIHTLIHEKEYYRAYAELTRLGALYPGYLESQRIGVAGLYLQYRAGRFRDITAAGGRAVEGPLGLIFVADAQLQIGRYRELFATMQLPGWSGYLERDDFRVKREFACAVMLGEFKRAGDAAARLKEPLRERGFLLLRDSVDAAHRRKVPFVAAALGIVPGLGYVYAGQGWTGLLAFLAVTVNTLVSYLAFTSGNGEIGAVTAVVGTFLYSGSIMGGYLSSRRFNERLDAGMGERIHNELDLDGDIEWIMRRYGIDDRRE